jgi:hypothetical protein
MEPNWTKRIPDWAICNWFYTFFVVNVIVFSLIIAASLYVTLFKTKNFTAPNMFFALLQLMVAGTNMLFYYLICDRSLRPTSE